MSSIVATEQQQSLVRPIPVAAEVDNHNDDVDVDDAANDDITALCHRQETVTSRCQELAAVWQLALPTLAIELGAVMPGFLTASYIGRNFTVEHLDGFTLANLTVNLFTLSLMKGLYSASETLSPQAYGAGNAPEVGVLAIRGFIASLMVVLPCLILLLFVMRIVLVWVGEDEKSAMYASHWYRVYAISLPFYALYEVTMKFLTSQHQMVPLVVCAISAMCLVLPLSLWAFGTLFGFLGTALANAVYQAFLSVSLLTYLWRFQPYHSSTWPGLKGGLKQALRRGPFLSYMALGAGGMLASSEWMYWEILSLMVGTFGVVPLSVHTIPTQIVSVSFMAPISLGIAVSIRLGATLPVSVARAQQTVADCVVLAVLLFGAMAIVMYIKQETLFGWFTTDDDVIAGCREIWWKVCVYSFHLSMFGVLMGISVGLGMQWTLGIATLVTLLLLGLPATYYFSVVRGGGLQAAWSTAWPPYTIIITTLFVAIVRANWDKIANDIRIREGAANEPLVWKAPMSATHNDDNNEQSLAVGVYGAA